MSPISTQLEYIHFLAYLYGEEITTMRRISQNKITKRKRLEMWFSGNDHGVAMLWLS